MCSPASFNDNIEIGISRVLDLRIEDKAWKCCGNIPVDKVFYNQDNIDKQLSNKLQTKEANSCKFKKKEENCCKFKKKRKQTVVVTTVQNKGTFMCFPTFNV